MTNFIRTSAYRSDSRQPVARIYQRNGSDWVEALYDMLALEPVKTDDACQEFIKKIDLDVLTEATERMKDWADFIKHNLDLADDEGEPSLDAELTFIEQISYGFEDADEDGQELYVVSIPFSDDEE